MLDIFYNTTDYSRELASYIDGEVTLTISDTDKIYVGYRKPISDLFIHMSLLNTLSLNVSVKYFNGTAFTDVQGLYDTTFQLTRNGFISWVKEEDEAKTTVNSKERYWYEISVDSTTDPITFDGINLVFSNDTDLKAYEPQIVSSKFYPSGDSSFITFHEGARNEIIQRLRNQGKGIYNGVEFYDLNIYDLNRPEQLKTASIYKVLSQIFFNRSDNPDDKYYQKFLDYSRMYNEAFDVFFLSIDTNDSGTEDYDERVGFQFGRITRI